MHEAVFAYFNGSQCGFKCHLCCLRRYPDYKHTLCPLCLDINSRWPPPPKDPPKPEKDPNLIYPGDIDPDFKPTRGDILVVNPAIGPSFRKLGFIGSCVVTYDGSTEFPFVRGDVLVRIGGYEIQIVEPSSQAEDKKGKNRTTHTKAPPKKKHEKMDNKPGAKESAKGTKGAMTILEKPLEPDQQIDLVTFKPYEKLQVYYYNGDKEWTYKGTQENLEMKQKVLLQTQCPGLTASYRYYKAGTKVLPHTLVPFLGEIMLSEWIWQEDFDHKANKWRAAGTWYRPDIPDRTKLRPGMILLRPLVGKLKAEGSTLLNTVEMERAKKREEAKMKEMADQQLLEKFLMIEKANVVVVTTIFDEKDDKKGKKDEENEKKDDKKKKEDKKDNNGQKNKEDDKNKGDKKDNEKNDKKKGGKKGAKEEEKKEEAPPELPPPPNNDEFLKLVKWGAVEMYRFEGEMESQGWTYYGRSNRICDTAYLLHPETSKPKFVHKDDQAQIIALPPEEKPLELESNEKDKKGKKEEKGPQRRER